ncbi:MAG: hydrogenase expression/formation protein HypE [bacterium]
MTDRILLAHGSGGRQSHDLISGMFMEAFGNALLDELDDAALLFAETGGPRSTIAFTTDGYVVKPRFFPGGDIGKLAVCGTVNDLAVMGAEPKYLSCGFIIEEGFPVEELKRILASMKAVLQATGVRIVTGDTKVVEKGAVDGIFITTSGIGTMRMEPAPGMARIKAGDALIVNGTLGDHGVAVMASREGLRFSVPVASDCAPLTDLIRGASEAAGDGVHFMRDATRGGLATVLNEIADSARLGVEIEEESVPVSEGVEGLCELLGLDPLYVANEGKVVFVVAEEEAEAVLSSLRKSPLGERAARIGTVTEKHPGKVALKTAIGGSRIVDMLVGEQLPRIC